MAQITLLTLAGCPLCVLTLNVLTKIQRKYNKLIIKEIDATSQEGRKLMQQYDIKSTPAIFINNRYYKQGAISEEELIKTLSELNI